MTVELECEERISLILACLSSGNALMDAEERANRTRGGNERAAALAAVKRARRTRLDAERRLVQHCQMHGC